MQIIHEHNFRLNFLLLKIGSVTLSIFQEKKICSQAERRKKQRLGYLKLDVLPVSPQTCMQKLMAWSVPTAFEPDQGYGLEGVSDKFLREHIHTHSDIHTNHYIVGWNS